jgi:hypothetical protein
MTVKGQSGLGRIRLFNDFFGGEEALDAEAKVVVDAKDFKLVGEGLADNDVQITTLDSDGLGGVVQIESADTDADSTCLVTSVGFDVGLMGTLVLETRVRFADFDTKVVFVGFTDDNQDALSIENHLFDVTAATTIENTASDICGFYLQSDMTYGTEWHAIYNGGATAASTDTNDNDLDVVAVAGEWDVLRLEVDNNGTARWWINGVVVKTLAGALSTSTDVAAVVGLGTVSGARELMDVDYLLVEANRDWNA